MLAPYFYYVQVCIAYQQALRLLGHFIFQPQLPGGNGQQVMLLIGAAQLFQVLPGILRHPFRVVMRGQLLAERAFAGRLRSQYHYLLHARCSSHIFFQLKYPITATINRKMVSRAVGTSLLWNRSGMAARLETFSTIQFSIFRFASSHMPAQAVADTKASADRKSVV